MTLVHYSKKSYEEAASEAATAAKVEMNALIDKGRGKASRILEKVMTEVPFDQVVKGSAIRFGFTPKIEEEKKIIPSKLLVNFFGERPGEEYGYEVRQHAFRQICERAGVPAAFADRLKDGEEWGRELLSHNLTTLFDEPDNRFLMRSYGGQLRGFLSNAYRRLDSRPLLEAFAKTCEEVGAVPVEGYGSDTRVALKALVPTVFEPADNEVVCFGVCWENSDYGNGAHALRAFILRLWCTNFAISNENMRNVHIGRRLNEGIAYSDKTYELDTKATASAIGDIVRDALSEQNRNLMLDTIRKAADEKVDVKKAINDLRKKLTKGEAEQVVSAFESPDVRNLPAGDTKWRLSNAISWIAQTAGGDDRKVELMKIAGGVLPQAELPQAA